MTVVQPVPLFIKDCVVDIAGVEYQPAITSVRFKAASSMQTVTAVSPGATYTEVTPATWSAEIVALQDWDDPTSFVRYLFDHEGETVTMTFSPRAGGTAFTADIIIPGVDIGGDVGTFADSPLSCGVSGKPQIVTGP